MRFGFENFKIFINVRYYGYKKYMDEDCTGRYMKSIDCHTIHRSQRFELKTIYFLILNEIVEYFIKILTVCMCKISI